MADDLAKRARGKRPVRTWQVFGASLAALAYATPASAAVLITGDPALYWSSLVSSTVAGSPIAGSRSIAMAQIAIYEAANLTTGRQYGSYFNMAASSGDTRAAVAVAARNVLVAVNPSQAAAYNAALDASLSQVMDGPAKAQGIALGNAIASATLAKRAGDGSGLILPYSPQAPGTPGAYQFTPGVMAAAFPQWQNVTPWVMSSTDQFLPPAPPALASSTYAIDFNEVKDWGGAISAMRTDDQTNSALVWASTLGVVPWHRVAVDLAQEAMAADATMDSGDAARIMALLALSNADTIIATWDAKYHYDFWRPYTAIRDADLDGNPDTDADSSWTSRIGAPPYPSYSSGLSAVAGNASSILTSFFGDAHDFCIVGSAGERCFNSLATAAQAGADSRIYGGIHFRFENTAGLELGRSVAGYTLENALGVVPEPDVWAMLILGFGVIGSAMRWRRPRRLRLSYS